jgi:aminoglycoside phosphotransferase
VVGAVVRRPTKPWTPAVHALLRHLHGCGLPVPEPLDYDETTERVRLLPGAAGKDAWQHQTTLESVRSAARLLRQVHDATVGWIPPTDAVWAVPSEPGDVVCHGDPQPPNLVWRDGRAVGIFDWDLARPSERLGDIAYSLEWLTPFVIDPAELRYRGFTQAPDRRARVDAFLEAYGWDEPLDVVEAVAQRQRQAIDEVVHLARKGHEPQATWVADGWPERWQAKLAVTRSLREALAGS